MKTHSYVPGVQTDQEDDVALKLNSLKHFNFKTWISWFKLFPFVVVDVLFHFLVSLIPKFRISVPDIFSVWC